MLRFMYRVALTNDQRHELQQRTRRPSITPATRDRLEMVRLADVGWSVPKIAQHLGIHEQTVRAWIKAFLAHGFDALTNTPRGGDMSAVTPAMLEAACAEVTKSGRTWSAGDIADWVAAQYNVRISAGRMRVHLKRATFSYQRTARSLTHKQHPEQVAARKAELEALEKKRMPG